MANETKLTVTKKPAEPALAGDVWRPFEALRKEIDRVFEDFDDGFWRQPFRSLAALERAWPSKLATTPAVDVSETDKAIEVTAELPGLEAKDVQLNLADNVLTIRGEKKSEREEKEKDYHLVERSFGSFARSVQLPDGVKPEDINAEIAKGVLKVTVKKPAPKNTKQHRLAAAEKARRGDIDP